MNDSNNNDDDEAHLPRPKRKLSRFLAKKMLYDFVSNRLDADRANAVSTFIKEDWETKRELEYLEAGLKYCERLTETKISEPLMQNFLNHKGFWEKLKSGQLWKEWPDMIKWGIEASLLSAVATAVVMLVPWGKISQLFPQPEKKIVLVEVNKEKSVGPESLSKSDNGVSEDSNHVDLDQKNKPSEEHNAGTAAQKQNQKSLSESSHASSSDTEEEESKVTLSAEEEEEGVPQAPIKNKNNFVYRAFMKLKNVDEVSPLIVERIKQLGGEKAGQVELGWKKANGRYFHFSLPEANYEPLMKVLREYGPVRIYRDPNSRVMPAGKNRFILFIEDDKKK